MISSSQLFMVRRALDKDLPFVVEINRHELPENYSPHFFKDMLDNHGEFFFVAEAQDKIVGYVMCRKEVDFSPFLGYPSLSPRGHVVSLAVRSTHRRMGIGVSLMLAAHEAMRSAGLKESYLEVRIDNSPAVELYKRIGYEVNKTISSYYLDGTSAHLMVLRL